MSALDRGERFVVTRRGVPVANLTPVGRRGPVSAEALLNALATTPKLDPDLMRDELDTFADQDPSAGEGEHRCVWLPSTSPPPSTAR
jgi:antitoxin (DNA-binding transcriptional repressor) of toxin-antitoxin stability system